MKAAPARRRSEHWRERLITLACQGLGWLFDLPAWLTGRVHPKLTDLAPGATVLVIKPCCLGDVLLATAALRAISQARPDLRLDFLVSDWARVALEGNPRLRRLVPTGVSGSHLSWRQYVTLAVRLRRHNYAAALVLDRSPRLTLLPWLAGIKVRAGLDNLGRGFALNVRATLPQIVRPEAEVYLDVVRALGVVVEQPRLEYIPSVEAVVSFGVKARQLDLSLDRPFAVIHPGGGQNPDTRVLSKRWPAPRFGEIAARLIRQGYRVLVIGAKDDANAARQIWETAHSNDVINLCDQFSVAESGVLLKQAALFVGNDTGLMHMAVACGVPTVAVFGPSNPVAFGPFTAQGRAVGPGVAANLPLREYQALSVTEGGIERVTVEAVWQAIEVVLVGNLRVK